MSGHEDERLGRKERAELEGEIQDLKVRVAELRQIAKTRELEAQNAHEQAASYRELLLLAGDKIVPIVEQLLLAHPESSTISRLKEILGELRDPEATLAEARDRSRRRR